MKFTEATTNDIPVIQKMAEAVWPHTFKDMLSPAQIKYMMDMMYSTENIFRQMTEMNNCYVILEDEGERVAYLAYENHYSGKPWTKIHKLYVMPDRQSKGYGRMLFDLAAERAKEIGDSFLTLNVNRDNQKAVDAYRRWGFEVIHSEDFDIGNGYLMTDHIMNYKL